MDLPTPPSLLPENCNVLHYVDNNKQCQSGELILMDVGAAYGNYASDMTRTVLSQANLPRQRTVYEAVLRVEKAAMQLLVPGTLIKEYHQEIGQIMTDELIGLGLLDQTMVKNQDPEKPAYKKYFMPAPLTTWVWIHTITDWWTNHYRPIWSLL